MDNDLLNLIRELAEVPTYSETPGVAPDWEMDDLIILARNIVAREANDPR